MNFVPSIALHPPLKPIGHLVVFAVALFLSVQVQAEYCERLPSLPSQEEDARWNHKKTEAMTRWSGSPNHRLHDRIYNHGSAPWLIGKFAYGLFDKDLKGEAVSLYVHKDENCGAWHPLGQQPTTKDESDEVIEGIANDGGRIYFQLEALSRGIYPIRARVDVDKSLASGTLYLLKEETPVVIFDIDGTLTRSDRELTSQLLSKISKGTYIPRMRPEARELAWEWFRRGALPVYLTGRPDNLQQLTRAWLEEQAFPPGPILLANRLRDAKPTRGSVGKFKQRELQRLIQTLKLNVAAAYGNASTDRFAYQNAQIPPHQIFLFGEHPPSEGYVILKNLKEHLDSLRRSPPLKAPQNWPDFWR